MRTFVAVEITDQDVINKIEKLQSQIRINAKPVDVKNIHFTLQFLGEITESNMEEIQKALKSIEFESFMLEFRGIGAFPKPKFPRVVWVGTDENGGEQLRKLSEQVENA
ncbi:MAG: RNA 2',3'-cyclic phosphodiesterase, partial [Nitrosopumilaceae archaeon]|nr:RNA 2',3'-cyclic phosphodiesterase [Nitrosopumilaceae archaeon]